MPALRVKGGGIFKGEIELPGDKSLSHRMVILSTLFARYANLNNISTGADVRSTIDVLRKCGVKIEIDGNQMSVYGTGYILDTPDNVLNCKNSGTTARILAGVFSSIEGFYAVLSGDRSLRKRPMLRVVGPLREMGAEISGREDGKLLPITINGKNLKGKRFNLPVASAQVKTSLLLAGLNSRGTTTIVEPGVSRDHTERLLKWIGIPLKKQGKKVSVKGIGSRLEKEIEYNIPGDISSASFFVTGAVLSPGSELAINNVLLNPTRMGFVNVLKKMGASIRFEVTERIPEPKGKMTVKYSRLRGVKVTAREIPLLIDELPLLALAAVFADGTTTISGAEELRYKESDRIKTTCNVLTKMGADIVEKKDGMIIKGTGYLRGSVINSFNDHRIAMMGAIAGCVAVGETEIKGIDCIKISFPEFLDIFRGVYRGEIKKQET